MKTVDMSTLRNNLKDVLEEVSRKRDYVLIARKGKLAGAVINLDLLEDLLAMTSHKYLKSIREAREDFKKGRVFTHEDVFGKI